MRAIVIVSLCVCLGSAADARADHGKIDRVEMANGDALMCEILSLERGQLNVETDAMGTVTIEWNKARRVVSPASYQVELSSGRRIVGSLDSPSAGRLSVRTTSGIELAGLLDIVRMAALEAGFWKSLDGSLDFGFNFAQSDNLTQFSLNAKASRRTASYLSQGSLNSQLTTDSSVSHQKRNTISASVQRFLGSRWFVTPLAQGSQSVTASVGWSF